MELTKKHLIYELLNIIRAGKGGDSDDETISHELLSYWIDSARNVLIRQDLEKNRTISNNIRQSLGCVPVSLVDASVCCNLVTECKVYRTSVKIPKTIELYQRDLITRVGPASITQPAFQLIPYERAAWVKYGPLPGINRIPKAFLFDSYIYILVPNLDIVLTSINIQGVFASPQEVSTFNTCEGTICYSDDSPYPISEHMLDPLKKIVLEYLRISANQPTDNIGDGRFKVESNVEKT